MNDAINKAAAELKEAQNVNPNKNLIGAIAGTAVAVGLELISDKGGIGSAITAGVAGALVVYKMSDLLEALDPDTTVAVAAGATSGLVASIAGRTYTKYFPNEG